MVERHGVLTRFSEPAWGGSEQRPMSLNYFLTSSLITYKQKVMKVLKKDFLKNLICPPE